jgi:hypothetical protein
MLKQWNDNETKFKKLFRQKENKKVKGGPKKSKSTYMFFCDNERQKLKTENLDLNNKEVITELAARWKKFKEDPKNSAKLDEYTKLAEEDKKRYESERENFVPEESSEEDSDKKKKKRVTSTSNVKKNKSSYMFFCAEERSNIISQNPEMNNKQIITELGARWKILKETNPSELEKFENLAKEDKERYAKEKSSESSNVSEEVVVQKPNKEKKTKALDVVASEDDSEKKSKKEKKPKEEKTEDKTKEKKEDKPKEKKPKAEDKTKKEEKPKKEKAKKN